MAKFADLIEFERIHQKGHIGCCSDEGGCIVCSEQTKFFDKEEKIYICSDECREKYLLKGEKNAEL